MALFSQPIAECDEPDGEHEEGDRQAEGDDVHHAERLPTRMFHA